MCIVSAYAALQLSRVHHPMEPRSLANLSLYIVYFLWQVHHPGPTAHAHYGGWHRDWRW